MVDKGFLITSIDEEGGLVNPGYETFAKRRYSNHTIGMSSAAFGWGEEDAETLKKFYPKHSSKIHMTGSPRVDLWKTRFSKFWSLPSSGVPKRPYLLVVSNMISKDDQSQTLYYKFEYHPLDWLRLRAQSLLLIAYRLSLIARIYNQSIQTDVLRPPLIYKLHGKHLS